MLDAITRCLGIWRPPRARETTAGDRKRALLAFAGGFAHENGFHKMKISDVAKVGCCLYPRQGKKRAFHAIFQPESRVKKSSLFFRK
jgi:hypothetical protein